MRTPSVALLLGVCVLLLSALTVSAVSLTVSPNLQQFFTGASVSLTCEGQLGSDGWTVKRDTGSGTESCGAGGRGFGRINGSSCFLDEFKPISGVYWCEGEAGEKSEEVNITVSDKHVILEIPAVPVSTGSDVTLRCKKKTGGTAAAYFYCNGRPVRPKSEKNITINVQQSDEGLYWCSTDDFGSSPQSFLRVRGSVTPISVTTTERATTPKTTTTTHISHPPPSPPSSSSSIFPAMAAVVFLCLLDLVLVVVLMKWWRQTGRTLPSLQGKVVYEGLTLKKTANKISIIQSHVVFSSLRTNTAGVSEESN
uniref:Immunoglobulin domain-containing protein n=1 Tax=Oreochromis aureus TaxID=47969 RepID=A0AAZ1X2T8_OREAU